MSLSTEQDVQECFTKVAGTKSRLRSRSRKGTYALCSRLRRSGCAHRECRGTNYCSWPTATRRTCNVPCGWRTATELIQRRQIGTVAAISGGLSNLGPLG
jgi:hypothetical protein